MIRILETVRALIAEGRYEVTTRTLHKRSLNNILLADIVAGTGAVVVEEYPDYHKGRRVLPYMLDHECKALHAL